MTNTDFCFILIRGKQITRLPMNNDEIEGVIKIIKNHEHEQTELLEMAKHDPIQ